MSSTLIGEGTYGCVFRPPLKCKNKQLNKLYNNPSFIMKVSTEEDIREERQIVKYLRAIDQDQDYFIYLIPIKKAEISQDLSQFNSKLIQMSPTKKFYGYFMKYGGITLDNYINKYPEKITIDLVMNWLMKLIYAISILQDNKIVHLDIKINNIVIDEENEDDIKIIDFSISGIVTGNKKVDKNLLVEEFYSVYPYFYNVLYSTNYNNLKSFYPTLINVENAISLFNSVDNTTKSKNNYINNVILPNIFKIDIYSLGYVFMYSIYMRFKDKFKEQDPHSTYLFKILLLNMLNCNPNNQYDINKCLCFIDTFIITTYISKKIDNLIFQYWLYDP